MPTSRRKFIQQTAMGVLATASIPQWLQAAAPNKTLTGVQLYSVRADMKKNPLATLKAVAEMGYKYVEHAYYINRKFYGYTPNEFKTILNDMGLTMPSGHTVMSASHWDLAKKDFTDEWKYTVEDAAIAGQELVISPSLDEKFRKSADDLKRFMDVFNKSGELCRKSGMRFGYHNHNFEFSKIDGALTTYDIILKYTDPAAVILQLDFGNLFETGDDALAIIQNNPGRFVSMHVKDEIKNEKGEFESTVLGKGGQKVKEIIALGKKIGGTQHLIVEQESYQGLTPLASIQEDLAVMKKWGY